MNFIRFWWTSNALDQSAQVAAESFERSLVAAHDEAQLNPLARLDELVDTGALNEARSLEQVAESSRPTTQCATTSQGAHAVNFYVETWEYAKPRNTKQIKGFGQCRRPRRRNHQRHRCCRVGSSNSTIDPPVGRVVAPNSGLLAVLDLSVNTPERCNSQID